MSGGVGNAGQAPQKSELAEVILDSGGSGGDGVSKALQRKGQGEMKRDSWGGQGDEVQSEDMVVGIPDCEVCEENEDEKFRLKCDKKERRMTNSQENIK